MTRRPPSADTDLFAGLQKKVEILERELAVQRAAIERLRTLGRPPSSLAAMPIRKTA